MTDSHSSDYVRQIHINDLPINIMNRDCFACLKSKSPALIGTTTAYASLKGTYNPENYKHMQYEEFVPASWMLSISAHRV